LFDEATSALDNRSQALVMRGLERMAITRVVVAHRLSTVRNADRIIVMVSGCIAQSGRYEELAAMPGPFADLMQRQEPD
jgi:ATP-binding cassette subfamily C protein